MTVMHVEFDQRPKMVEMSTKFENKELWNRLQPSSQTNLSQLTRVKTGGKTTASHLTHKLEASKVNETSTTSSKRNKNLNKIEKPSSRGKRKSRWKLKFHHQALPPEYLKHYKQQEKKRLKESKRNLRKSKEKKPVPVKVEKKCFQEQEDVNHEMTKNFDSLKQRLNTEMKNNVGESVSGTNQVRVDEKKELGLKRNELLYDTNTQHFLSNILSKHLKDSNKGETKKKCEKPRPIPSSGRIRNFSDLPYMGEITLDGIKPRRGRKPKKADICHLIYKNYGQVFPGGPASNDSSLSSSLHNKSPPDVDRFVESPLPTVTGLLNHSEVQNRIINSLLERRLTSVKAEHVEEPLNLCIKDLNSLKIKLSRKHGNVYQTNHPVKVECGDNDDIGLSSDEDEEDDDEDDDDRLAPFNLVTTELGESSDDEIGYLNENVTLTRINKTESAVEEVDSGKVEMKDDSPFICWPGNNLYMNPLLQSQLMYYQKFSKELRDNSETQPVEDNKVGVKKSLSKKSTKRCNGSGQQSAVKRKRSAIFIPPLPAENTTNPTTEVSICKFKFTGGAKPSLQEKKMLSVDSGGNFRYYSGTGDKNMRGYEYFPRESLQQCQDIASNTPAGVFLAASAMGSGERIPEEIGQSGFFDTNIPIPNLTKKKNDLKFDSYQCLSPDVTIIPEMTDSNQDISSDKEDLDFQNIYDNVLREEACKKLKKSKKSIAREKLEQTFKEKGFLIQTQQLESAEGATYCKFRQLRKFTRYLFRSWKDYLPGNVRDLSVDAGVENNELCSELDEAPNQND